MEPLEPVDAADEHVVEPGLDERIVAMYARGMSVRDIRSQLQEIYGTEVSPDLISRVTDAVIEDARAWQSRPLESVYPVLYLDALQVRVCDGHTR